MATKINRPELGVLVNSPREGYLCYTLRHGTVAITNKHHSLALFWNLNPKVKTTSGLINLSIANVVSIKLDSPYLTSLSIDSHPYCIRQRFTNLTLIETYRTAYTPSLRHVRLAKFASVSCRLNIKPTACLEILMMPNATGPMYSSSSSLRLLTSYNYTHAYPSVSRIRKNKEPVMTIRCSNTIIRHEPGTIKKLTTQERKSPELILGRGGELVQERLTPALIVPPLTRSPYNVAGSKKKYMAHRNLYNPLSKIFYCPDSSI